MEGLEGTGSQVETELGMNVGTMNGEEPKDMGGDDISDGTG